METVPLDTHRLVKRLKASAFNDNREAADVLGADRERALAELATKADLAAVDAELRAEIAALRAEMQGEIDRLNRRIDTETARLEAEMAQLERRVNVKLGGVTMMLAALLATMIAVL